jgi:hypothetical protein
MTNAAIAMVQRCGNLAAMTVTEDANSCTVYTKRRDNGAEYTCTWTQADAIAAKLAMKQTWQAYPREMRRSRCLMANFRVNFADVLLGMYNPEEMGAEVSVDERGEERIVGMTVLDEEPTPTPAAGAANQVPAAPAAEEAPKRRGRTKKEFKAEEIPAVAPQAVIEGEYTEEAAETDGSATRLALVPDPPADEDEDNTPVAGFDENGDPITPEGEAAAAEAEAEHDEETGETGTPAWTAEDEARVKTIGDLRNFLVTKDLATPAQQTAWKAKAAGGAYADVNWSDLKGDDQKDARMVLYLAARDGEE